MACVVFGIGRQLSKSAIFALAVASVACGSLQVAPQREPAPVPLPAVNRLLPLEFSRVVGPAAKGAVLDTGAAGTWRAQVAGLPTVDFDGVGYRMWFAGGVEARPTESPNLYHRAIGLATSKDGVHWALANGGLPVFDHGPAGAFDSHSVNHPFVLRVGRKYFMWYAGADGKQGSQNVRIERLGLATSSDGTHWKRENGGRPVLDVGSEGAIDSTQASGASVLRANGQFVMWYGAYNGLHAIAMATSPDGEHWQKTPQRVTGLDFGGEEVGPSVYFDGRTYLMLYNSKFEPRWTLQIPPLIDTANPTISGGVRDTGSSTSKRRRYASRCGLWCASSAVRT